MRFVGIDVETTGVAPGYGLQPCRALMGHGRISAVSVAVNGKVSGTLAPDARYLMRCLHLGAASDAYLVGWNVAFDAAWFIASGLEREVFACQWLDAMLLWRHLTIAPSGEDVPKSARKSYSLDAAMREFFPEQAEFKAFKDFDAADSASLEALLKRNKGDAVFTARLAEMFWSQLTAKQQRAALIEAQSIPMVAWTKVYGLCASRDAAVALSVDLKKQAEDLQKKLEDSCAEAKGVNFGSPAQLQKLLYDDWGLPVSRQSKKTLSPSTDKYALYHLAAADPRARLVRDLREAKNNRVKYPEATIKSLEYNGDGCVRPQAVIFSTYSGRMTYSSRDNSKSIIQHTKKNGGVVQREKKVELPVGVALHQWKRGKNYRRLLTPPPGHLLTEFDFAGQEFRWMAVASGDETMLALCAPGEDPHGFMGAQVSGRDYRELVQRVKAGDADAAAARKAGKFCNLSYQYRISAAAATVKAQVDYEMDVDEDFICRTQTTYKQSYRGVPMYWLNQMSKCSVSGYAETFAGRRVSLKGNWRGRDKWGLESTAINYPIQGTGADQKYLALAVARGLLPKYDGHFYFELHDGLFFIFPEDKALAAADEFKRVLSNLPYKAAWGVNLPIQFPVDAKAGTSWGDLKEV